MTIESFDDCHRFQSDLDRLQEWCSGRKFSFNAANASRFILIEIRNPLGLTTALRVMNLNISKKIKDFGVIIDTRMSFFSHVGTTISKSARVLGFIKLISWEFNDHYTDKALFVSLVRPNLEWLVSGPLIRSATRRELSVSSIDRFALHWKVNQLPAYDSRCSSLDLQ
jgi:hypothetical protein